MPGSAPEESRRSPAGALDSRGIRIASDTRSPSGNAGDTLSSTTHVVRCREFVNAVDACLVVIASASPAPLSMPDGR